MKARNKKLAKVADEAGVIKYGVFQNYGYMGLYGGFGQKEIHAKNHLIPGCYHLVNGIL